MTVVNCVIAFLIAGTSVLPAQDTIRVPPTEPKWGTAVKLVPIFAIGQVDGPPEYAFGEVSLLAVDRSNRFYVFDGNYQQIRAYDARGKFTRRIGRAGAGPGEYREIPGMDILSDSILAIVDPANARVSLFRPDGKLLRALSVPRASTAGEHSFGTDAAGFIYYYIGPRMPGGPDKEEFAIGRPLRRGAIPAKFLRIRADGGVVDSVVIPSLTASVPRGFFLIGINGGDSFTPSLYTMPSAVGGIVSGLSDKYRFIIRPMTGPVRVVERPWTPIKVEGAERANWQEYADMFNKRMSPQSAYTIPTTKPAYRDLMVDRDGRIWVSLYTKTEKRDVPPKPDGKPSLRWRQNATYDVFDPSGVYLARIALPKDSKLLWAQGNQIWTLAKGPDDEDKIVSFRLSGIK